MFHILIVFFSFISILGAAVFPDGALLHMMIRDNLGLYGHRKWYQDILDQYLAGGEFKDEDRQALASLLLMKEKDLAEMSDKADLNPESMRKV